MSTQSLGKYLLILCLVALLGFIGYGMLNAPDKRNAGEKVSDAINALPNGVDKASRQLKDRTPGDKLNDAVNDAGDDIKKPRINHRP